MSTQACRIKGFGYKLDYDEDVFSHIKNEDDEEYNFIDVIGLDGGYYDMRDLKSDTRTSPLRIFTDGMCGDYKYVIYVTEASYIENTHGDERWVNKYRDDEFVREYAKQHIETLTGKSLDEPIEVDFEHYQ